MRSDLLRPEDVQEWEEALPASRAAFGSVGFARVQEAFGATCRLLVADAGGAAVAYPFLLQPLPSAIPGAAGRLDVATPAFTGPMPLGAPDPEALVGTRQLLRESVAALRPVTEFAHVHPWRCGLDVLGHTDVVQEREIVYVDLDLEDGFEAGYSRTCRKNVRRARSAGVVVRECETPADMSAFHRVYDETMRRRGALQRYRFPRDFFVALRAELPGHSRFVVAEVQGRVVAATVYLFDGTDVYSYLGGADMAYQSLRPTNLIVHETAAWARRSGRRRLVLGGGYRVGDGIERFKAGFSPLRAPLPQLRRIHDVALYDRLVAAAGTAEAPASYFPPYRDGREEDAG